MYSSPAVDGSCSCSRSLPLAAELVCIDISRTENVMIGPLMVSILHILALLVISHIVIL